MSPKRYNDHRQLIHFHWLLLQQNFTYISDELQSSRTKNIFFIH